MFKLVKQLFSLLSPGQRKKFFALQLLVMIMAFMEILGVASIIPFMSLLGDMSQLEEETIIAQIYLASNIGTEYQFMLVLGAGVLFTLLISAIISMFTTWRLSLFASSMGADIAARLYIYYLSQNWLYHTSANSAHLMKQVANEAGRTSGGILMPLMQMNARIVLAFFMGLTIFLYDPRVALVGMFIFAVAYFLIFALVRIRLHRNGTIISEVNEQRFRLMNEGFGGIKDLLLLGRVNDFINRFILSGHKHAYSQGTNAALTQTPRFFIELLAFGSMISLLLYLIATHNGNLGFILPILSVYALATFKLLPAFQLIYGSIADIRGNMPAFEAIYQDLVNSKHTELMKIRDKRKYLIPNKNISLENVTFRYPEKEKLILDKLNMKILANSAIGIVGPSGSGKSTLIDILLGLIQPDSGQLKVDNKIIDNENRRLWQNTIGFVPQNIFLSGGTIAENVAFGIPRDQINIEKVHQAIKLAHLNELLESLDKGINTEVGERGIQLSGGQRQRIGIARALYHDAEVLVFDEATSSLDGITEKMIMEAIHDFSGKKTIIMIAHRLKTVKNCDQIFFIDNGKLVDQGKYNELIERNKHFKNMAEHV